MKNGRRRKQLSLFSGYQTLRNSAQFGGALVGKNNAKEKRPFSSKHPMHIVMRSSLATRERSMLFYSRRIYSELQKQARKHYVVIKNAANAGNHIHLIVLAKNREHFKAFLRGIASTIARMVMRIKRGQRKLSIESASDSKRNEGRRPRRFWDFIPWTTILSCWTAFGNGMSYVRLNRIELRENLERADARERLQKLTLLETRLARKSSPLLPLGFA